MSVDRSLARTVTLNMNVAHLRDNIFNSFTEDSLDSQFLSTENVVISTTRSLNP